MKQWELRGLGNRCYSCYMPCQLSTRLSYSVLSVCLFVFIQDSSHRQARVGTTDGTFREHSYFSSEDGCVDLKSLSPNRSTPVTVDSVNQEKVHHPYL